ncbi:hypothetical protein [uncultured Marixanthomonas sp.]|uniref:hypothetical protein n=1 Tax=uncultured Marixanthomonas sp. TaxID=757245 RepID=UPI0030DC0ADD|tara:strand:- start:282497 stop:282718 length:222 start_codon:yes stop_codon:yes gene_type:complete
MEKSDLRPVEVSSMYIKNIDEGGGRAIKKFQGFFHCWNLIDGINYAVIEDIDGNVGQYEANNIKFLDREINLD